MPEWESPRPYLYKTKTSLPVTVYRKLDRDTDKYFYSIDKLGIEGRLQSRDLHDAKKEAVKKTIKFLTKYILELKCERK